MAKTANEKLEETLGSLEDLIKAATMQTRCDIADELTKEVTKAHDLEDWAAELDLSPTDWDSFRKGIRFAAKLLADKDFDY